MMIKQFCFCTLRWRQNKYQISLTSHLYYLFDWTLMKANHSSLHIFLFPNCYLFRLDKYVKKLEFPLSALFNDEKWQRRADLRGLGSLRTVTCNLQDLMLRPVVAEHTLFFFVNAFFFSLLITALYFFPFQFPLCSLSPTKDSSQRYVISPCF